MLFRSVRQMVFYNACGYESLAFRQLPNGSLQHKQSGLCLARPGSETADHTPLILQMNCNVPFSLDP